MKACSRCGERKSLDEFSRDKSRSDGRTHRCKPCDSKKAMKWQSENKELHNATKSAYRAANAERARAWRKGSEARHRSRIAARNRSRRATMGRGMDALDRSISIEYRMAIAGDPCFYCGTGDGVMQVDHYVSIALNGTDHWFNLVQSCEWCNKSKHTRCGTWMKLCGPRPSTALSVSHSV